MKAQHFAKLLIDRKVSVNDMVSFLQKHSLLTLLPSIMEFLKHKEAQHLAHNTLVIESPFPLKEGSVSVIKKRIGDNFNEVEMVENKSLLAGYVARFRGVEYDASAKSILENFIRN